MEGNLTDKKEQESVDEIEKVQDFITKINPFIHILGNILQELEIF